MAARRHVPLPSSIVKRSLPGSRKHGHGGGTRAGCPAGYSERRFGRIANITSLSVYVPIPVSIFVGRARGSHLLARGRGADGGGQERHDRNNLLPGKIDTDRLKTTSAGDESDDERKARLSATVPARRLGTIEEFGQICAFLFSVHAGYLTGQNIPIDGGTYISAF